MSKVTSPLRYPGGKAKTFKMVKSILEYNNLLGCIYIEPFAGGASLALKLLYEGLVSKIIINDYDRSIYALWYSLKYYNDELCNMIENTSITIFEWQNQKKIQLQKEKVDLLTLGFSTFFLNRTNRSGIISAGPIGGYKQDGNYKIDCRFNKKELIKRIKTFKKFSHNIEIKNMDAKEFLNKSISKMKKKCFLFIDPPYYKKGKDLYMNFFNHSDHVSLEKVIRKLQKPYILTYDNDDHIKNIYNNYNIELYRLTYTTEKKYRAEELLIYNSQLLTINNVFLPK